jgi:hypothetical protein
MINLRRKWDYDTDSPSDLEMTFKLAVPQTMGDQTWYFGCENVPAELPEGYSILEGELEKFIGYGLSKEDVEMLRK